MYIVTGDGLQVLPLRDTGALKVRQWELVGNTIVGLMDNGCNGNVIYIPLDFVPAAPKKPAVKPSSKPVEPGVPTTPDMPTQETYTVPRCYPDGYIHIETWLRVRGFGPFNDQLLSQEKTNEPCGGGGGDGG